MRGRDEGAMEKYFCFATGFSSESVLETQRAKRELAPNEDVAF
jgi:hypothetical protein